MKYGGNQGVWGTEVPQRGPGAEPEFDIILAQKNYQNTRSFVILFQKINKVVEFYMNFARKHPNFT